MGINFESDSKVDVHARYLKDYEMKNSIAFPFQQGDLDWLCSIYATINLSCLRGDIVGVEAAGETFNELSTYVSKSGDLYQTITAGVRRGDVTSFLRERGYKAKKFSKPSQELIREHSRNGAIIYLRNAEGFDHYTVIRTAAGSTGIELYDSYRFSEISCRDGVWFLDGEEFEVPNLYAVIE